MLALACTLAPYERCIKTERNASVHLFEEVLLGKLKENTGIKNRPLKQFEASNTYNYDKHKTKTNS